MYCPFKMVAGGKDVNCAKERCEWYIEESKKCAMKDISISLDIIQEEIKEKSHV